MVVFVGFWEQQAQDLLTSVRELGGLPSPQDSPDPSLDPYPYPPTLTPPSDVVSRGAIDGVHGTDSYPMPVVQPPGQLGPYGYHEGAPGVWLPDDGDGPGGQTSPSSGRAADAAASSEASLRRSGELRQLAEGMLARNLTQAHAAAAESRMRMSQLHQEIKSGCDALEPAMGRQSGKEQMARLLDSKAVEVKQVVDHAQNSSSALAANLLALGEQFSSGQSHQ